MRNRPSVKILAAVACLALSSSYSLRAQDDSQAQEQSRQQAQQQQEQQARSQQQEQERSGRRRGQGERRRQSDSRRSQRVKMDEVRVASPDGKIEFVVLPNAERLSYTVKMDGTTVIEPSTLNMIVDGYDLASGVVMGSVERFETNESFPWHGAHSVARDRSNGVRIALTNDLSFTLYTLEIRAFDSGVAFRFIVPGKDGESRVPDEYSTFVLPAGTTVWFQDLENHYESTYNWQDIADVKPGQWAGPPLTFQLPNDAGYGSITEANLVNYAGIALEADGRRGWTTGLGHRQPLNYPYELRYGRDEGKRLGKPAAVAGTITTPWRVVLVGRDLNALVNSDVLPSLCPPADPKLFPDGMNTKWVAAGKSVWDYVDRNYGNRNNEERSAGRRDNGENDDEQARAARRKAQIAHMKDFSRLGSQIGATYHILEGFAYRWSDDEIRDFVDYSNKQGVRALFWRHSNQLKTPDEQEEFFKRLHDLGVAGAKIDFIDQETKEGVDQYESLLRTAAKYQCVIDFHGANKPTGRLRTWPNDMIHEAVKGMEASRLEQRARHEAILPFTRYLAGPCDYTTMVFNERRGDSTWAHQIASLATFHSPILTIAAHPQSVIDNPAANMIESIPAVWDETIVLPESRIGELSVFARRKGDMWMLAVMSGTNGGKINVPLSFLGDGKYHTWLVKDNMEKSDAVVLEEQILTRDSTVPISMRPGGGFLGQFVKE